MVVRLLYGLRDYRHDIGRCRRRTFRIRRMILVFLVFGIVFAMIATVGALLALAGAVEKARKADQRLTIIVRLISDERRTTPPPLPRQTTNYHGRN
jgi:hypothetical protein